MDKRTQQLKTVENTKRIIVSTQIVYARPSVMQSSQLAGEIKLPKTDFIPNAHKMSQVRGEGNFQIWILQT